MLADESISLPSSSSGWLNAAVIGAAMRSTSVSLRMPSSRIANSSPPRRATVSDGRVDFTSRCAAACSRRSPASCPSESLTFLKLSRSRNMTATSCCERCASASACSTRFQNRLRLASSVSGSWKASLRSCSSSTLRSLTSRKLSASPAIAGSSIRLLPTHSRMLRRSPVSTTNSIGPMTRPGVAATSARNAASRSRSPSAQRSKRLRPTRSSGWIAKARSAAGEANCSWPSASVVMITSEAFLISDA